MAIVRLMRSGMPRSVAVSGQGLSGAHTLGSLSMQTLNNVFLLALVGKAHRSKQVHLAPFQSVSQTSLSGGSQASYAAAIDASKLTSIVRTVHRFMACCPAHQAAWSAHDLRRSHMPEQGK